MRVDARASGSVQLRPRLHNVATRSVPTVKSCVSPHAINLETTTPGPWAAQVASTRPARRSSSVTRPDSDATATSRPSPIEATHRAGAVASKSSRTAGAGHGCGGSARSVAVGRQTAMFGVDTTDRPFRLLTGVATAIGAAVLPLTSGAPLDDTERAPSEPPMEGWW